MDDDKSGLRVPSRGRSGDPTWRTGPFQILLRPTLLALTVLAGLFVWVFPIPNLSPTEGSKQWKTAGDLEPSEPPFSWSLIKPSKSLKYYDCFGGFQCARLDVPMDWHRTDGQGARMALAITRLPAKVSVTDPRYGGAILINPGGPGGSGVAQALVFGRDLQTIVDATDFPSNESAGLYYDIIGFDPRGVNNTTPGFSCFPNLFAQKNWELQAEADGMLGSSVDSFMRNWQRALALNAACSRSVARAFAGGDILGEHTNTPPVARDMLEIVERHGEWREKQGAAAQRQLDLSHGRDPQQTILTRTKWRRGKEKLLYWGRSYGTVLGATFAALYPDRVQRMLLDAVVDAEKYYTDVGPESILDADAIFDKFALYCDVIGEGCPFNASGPEGIKELYKSLENKMYNSSMAVWPSAIRGPEVVTWTDLKTVLRIAVYQPLAGFAYLADIAADLLKGDGSRLADFKHGRRAPTCPTNECLVAGPWSTECEVPGQNEQYATSAILCTDAEYMQNTDQEDFKRHWHGLQEASSVTGDYWAHTRLNCVGWAVKAKWKMTAPVTGNTSFPILLVNNILDPVTPLASAKKMNQAFPGSVLLQQDSEGHCTLAAPSTCINQSIRKYFQKGELPDPGTVCKADLKPLLGAPDEDEGTFEVSWREAVFREALRERTLFPM
ncbi:TAP-like protein-domain-containing protein [Aspergillus unguis]